MYPLSDKKKLVTEVSDQLNNKEFSLYVKGDSFFHGGGFTELFILQNKNPKKSYIYPFYDWMYKAHSLYTINPTNVDQERVVVIGPKDLNFNLQYTTEYKIEVNNLKAVIIDNTFGNFDEKTLDSR